MAKWMVTMKKSDFDATASKFGIRNITARLLTNRGVMADEDVDRYLNGDISMINDPEELYDIGKGAEIMLTRIQAGARIRVIGDYDVDGICSSYILVSGIRLLGGDVDCVLPDRMKDGYGLSVKLVDQAHEDGIDTIITCDNGIAAAEQIAHAKELGMTVVVTDHHEVPFSEDEQTGERQEILPPADAVIDPKRADGNCTFKEICGAVVAYKFLQVLFGLAGRADEQEAKDFFSEMLIFAGMATVCDVMELRQENRIIVKESLKRIAHTSNRGLRALINVNGLDADRLSAYHYGFVLGPCLNATGRLDLATRALKLFMEEDEGEAAKLAKDLKDLNDSRKDQTAEGIEKAVALVESEITESGLPKVLVLYLGEEVHESLAGIVAGKVREKYSRPTIVLTDAADGGIKGSGRSTENYDMFASLSACKELFTKFGGHKMAAGLSLPKENLPELTRRLNEACNLKDEDFEPILHIDMVLPFQYADIELVREFNKLEPFGNGNSKPVFAQKDVKLLRGFILGKNKNVGKFRVSDGPSGIYDMMYFGDLEKLNESLAERYGQDRVNDLYNNETVEPMTMKIAYHPDINSYQGRESLQIIMSDYCF
jgi:single-stranded-DNA-specific exonuclease